MLYRIGRSTVVTGGTTVAVTNYSGAVYPQQPMKQTQVYGYAPQQGYVYSTVQPMQPPYPGREFVVFFFFSIV